MQTDQATLVLSSLLRPSRRFQSYDLGKAAKQRIFAVEGLLEAFEEAAKRADSTDALAMIEAAYRSLGAEPPAAGAKDILSRQHPVLVAADSADASGEARAWHTFLAEIEGGD
jgi:hypothetical protein